MDFVRKLSYNEGGCLGLKLIRQLLIPKLLTGLVQHEIGRSGNIDEKNLLLTGAVSVFDVVELLYATKGSEYQMSKHHVLPSIAVHIFKPKQNGIQWYIKCYVLEPDVWFISVHH